jgi:endonuclease YncB( thermonuclease family)
MGTCISYIKNNPQSATELLESIDPKTVPKVPFQDQIIYARIEEIYDGDTVKIIILFGDLPVKLSLRILGIDTPEIKHGEGRLPEEHHAAIKVRDYMRSLFQRTDKKTTSFISSVEKSNIFRLNIAKICIRDWDKYGGRVLGDLFLPTGENVSEILISGGWARPYRGEKKKAWTLEELTAHPFV